MLGLIAYSRSRINQTLTMYQASLNSTTTNQSNSSSLNVAGSGVLSNNTTSNTNPGGGLSNTSTSGKLSNGISAAKLVRRSKLGRRQYSGTGDSASGTGSMTAYTGYADYYSGYTAGNANSNLGMMNFVGNVSNTFSDWYGTARKINASMGIGLVDPYALDVNKTVTPEPFPSSADMTFTFRVCLVAYVILINDFRISIPNTMANHWNINQSSLTFKFSLQVAMSCCQQQFGWMP